MHLLIRLVVNAIVIYLIATYLPGFHINGPGNALLAAVILGLINAIIRPILLLLSLPLEIITLGLFTIIINALCFWLAVVITPGFRADGFIPILEAAVILTIISVILSHVFSRRV